MASFNQIFLLGNLTREPETKFLPSGMAVCSFGIAVNKKLGGDKPDRVLFIDCTVFDKQAQIAGEYLHKGSQVLINGELVLDQWEKDGVKHSRHKVTVNNFTMLGPGGKGGSHAPSKTEDEYPQTAPPARSNASPAGDDIPF